MSKVIEFTNGIRNRILSNLNGRVYPINVFATTHGVKNFSIALTVLNKMVADGEVCETSIPIPLNDRASFKAYRLPIKTFDYR